MKFVKFSVLALTLGMFIASCGNGSGENKPADTTAAPAATPAPDTTHAAMPADTTHKMADTAKKM